MGKLFAVATVIKTLEGNTLNEHLTLKIVRGQESRGDAFLKVFYDEKQTMYPGGGCYLASVLEIQSESKTEQLDVRNTAIDLLRRLRNVTSWVEMPDESGELRNEIDRFLDQHKQL